LKNSNQILGLITTPTPVPLITNEAKTGFLEVSKGNGTVQTYSDPIVTSIPVATINEGQLVYFFKKENGWYQLSLDQNQIAWVQDTLVTEIN